MCSDISVFLTWKISNIKRFPVSFQKITFYQSTINLSQNISAYFNTPLACHHILMTGSWNSCGTRGLSFLPWQIVARYKHWAILHQCWEDEIVKKEKIYYQPNMSFTFSPDLHLKDLTLLLLNALSFSRSRLKNRKSLYKKKTTKDKIIWFFR